MLLQPWLTTGQADSWDVPNLVEFRGVDQLLRQQGEATQELRRCGESVTLAADALGDVLGGKGLFKMIK